jgi:hypothetical protein
MTNRQQRYLAYMLRLWQIGEDRMAWRASLEDAHSGARQGFGSLTALFATLEEKTTQAASTLPNRSCSDPEDRRERDSESLPGE